MKRERLQEEFQEAYDSMRDNSKGLSNEELISAIESLEAEIIKNKAYLLALRVDRQKRKMQE